MTDFIKIFTDGSGDNRKRDGGFGIVLIYKEEEVYYQSDKYTNTSSARMEIRGVLKALQLVENKSLPVALYCDNQYVVNSIAKGWAYKWESEDWIDGKSNFPGSKRKNWDLFVQLLAEIRKFKRMPQFKWVKGHNGHEHNEICDILAGEARKSDIIIDDSVINS